MILATTKVEDVDRFLDVFSHAGAEKRAAHGSKGSTVFRDPTEADRVWALFDWDEAGWASFVSDPTEEDRVWALFDWDEKGWQAFVSAPEVPPILKAAGHLGKPQSATLLGTYRA